MANKYAVGTEEHNLLTEAFNHIQRLENAAGNETRRADRADRLYLSLTDKIRLALLALGIPNPR